MPIPQESADWLQDLSFRRPCESFFCKTKNGMGIALYDHGKSATLYLNCASTEITMDDIGYENTKLDVYRAIAQRLEKLPDHDRETVEKTFRLKEVSYEGAEVEALQEAAKDFPRIPGKPEFLVDPQMEEKLDEKMGFVNE